MASHHLLNSVRGRRARAGHRCARIVVPVANLRPSILAVVVSTVPNASLHVVSLSARRNIAIGHNSGRRTVGTDMVSSNSHRRPSLHHPSLNIGGDAGSRLMAGLPIANNLVSPPHSVIDGILSHHAVHVGHVSAGPLSTTVVATTLVIVASAASNLHPMTVVSRGVGVVSATRTHVRSVRWSDLATVVAVHAAHVSTERLPPYKGFGTSMNQTINRKVHKLRPTSSVWERRQSFDTRRALRSRCWWVGASTREIPVKQENGASALYTEDPGGGSGGG